MKTDQNYAIAGTYTFGIHNRTVLSLDADATKWPDGEKHTDNTASLCPTNRYARICGLRFQTMRQESRAPEAANRTIPVHVGTVKHIIDCYSLTWFIIKLVAQNQLHTLP